MDIMDEHFICPQCEYDLHGIPSERCPECGFGFDLEALRSIAVSDGMSRLEIAEKVVVRASLVIALLVPTVATWCSVPPLISLVLGQLAVVVAVFVWVMVSDGVGLENVFNIVLVMLLFTFSCGMMLISKANILLCAAILVTAWLLRLREWPPLPPASNVGSPYLHSSVVSMSKWAEGLLVTATVLLVLTLFA